jgi:hypothetical protein
MEMEGWKQAQMNQAVDWMGNVLDAHFTIFVSFVFESIKLQFCEIAENFSFHYQMLTPSVTFE